MLAPRLKANGRAFAHIAQYHPELTALRRDLHAHPELGFEEVYTSARVNEALKLCGVDEIHTLHQQRPARPGEGRQRTARERPVAQRPAPGVADDQAGLDILPRGEGEQRRAIHRRPESREGGADDQGPALPVAPHEAADADRAKMGERLSHRRIIGTLMHAGAGSQ